MFTGNCIGNQVFACVANCLAGDFLGRNAQRADFQKTSKRNDAKITLFEEM